MSSSSAIIGANLGTTSTAVLAAVKATTSANRVALGHIAFNLVTACVALAVLPWLLAGISWVAGDAGVAPQLALFHTIFNLLGLALLLPFAGRLAGLLERMFRSAEEDLARPRHLDPTAAGAPDLAIAALWLELARLRDITGQVCLAALRPNEPHGTPPAAAAVVPLADAIAAFVTTMRTESMTREVSDELPRVLRTARYLEEAARCSTEADAARRNVPASRPAAVRALAGAVMSDAASSIAPSPSEEADADRLDAFQRTYQAGKSGLLPERDALDGGHTVHHPVPRRVEVVTFQHLQPQPDRVRQRDVGGQQADEALAALDHGAHDQRLQAIEVETAEGVARCRSVGRMVRAPRPRICSKYWTLRTSRRKITTSNGLMSVPVATMSTVVAMRNRWSVRTSWISSCPLRPVAR